MCFDPKWVWVPERCCKQSNGFTAKWMTLKMDAPQSLRNYVEIESWNMENAASANYNYAKNEITCIYKLRYVP